MLKRILSIFAISLIITGLFFEGYSLKCPVFADDTTDGWLNVTTNEQLVEAFKYYCKSRDLTIEGSVADAVTSFTTKTFNGICNTLGIDVTALQGQLKYKTDGNQGLQFLFTTTGVSAYNQIFAQFLQDNELSVGDTVNNDELINTKYLPESNSFLYVFNGSNSTSNNGGTVVTKGTPYIYTYDDIKDMNTNTSKETTTILYQESYRLVVQRGDYSTIDMNVYKGNTRVVTTALKDGSGTPARLEGNPALGYNLYDGCIYYGSYKWRIGGSDANNFIGGYRIKDNNNDAVTATVYITTNNKTINNNNYEGDTVINNNGDIINNNPDNPDNPDLPPSNPSVPDSGGWQDFQMPTMPNDWLIYGMEKKFPFDIPFNIMFGLSLLNHEPEIPKFEGDIDLKICTWHYDIDLTPFDDIAKILRKFEVLAFIIGLAILTKELIMWG